MISNGLTFLNDRTKDIKNCFDSHINNNISQVMNEYKNLLYNDCLNNINNEKMSTLSKLRVLNPYNQYYMICHMIKRFEKINNFEYNLFKVINLTDCELSTSIDKKKVFKISKCKKRLMERRKLKKKIYKRIFRIIKCKKRVSKRVIIKKKIARKIKIRFIVKKRKNIFKIE